MHTPHPHPTLPPHPLSVTPHPPPPTPPKQQHPPSRLPPVQPPDPTPPTNPPPSPSQNTQTSPEFEKVDGETTDSSPSVLEPKSVLLHPVVTPEPSEVDGFLGWLSERRVDDDPDFKDLCFLVETYGATLGGLLRKDSGSGRFPFRVFVDLIADVCVGRHSRLVPPFGPLPADHDYSAVLTEQLVRGVACWRVDRAARRAASGGGSGSVLRGAFGRGPGDPDGLVGVSVLVPTATPWAAGRRVRCQFGAVAA